MALSKEKIFERKVRQLMKQADKMSDDGVKRVIRMLSDARKEVAATVASTEWQAYYLPQMKAAIERALEDFGQKYGVEMQDMQRQFWDHGIDMVDLPLREIGIWQAMPAIDTTMLSILQGYSSDLVTGLTKDAVKRINTEITLGLMGQKSPYEVLGAVGRNFKDKSIFKSIRDRADTIVSTETGRILESASHLRKQAAASVIPGLKKVWFYGHSPKSPRLDHQAAAARYAPGGDPGPIPVDEPFLVGGEKLMYPKDPAGSAKNTIRCGCTSLLWHPDWEDAVEAMAA
jgi:hypothetical protein